MPAAIPVSDLAARPPATGLAPNEVVPLKNSTVPAAPVPVTVAVNVGPAGATTGDAGVTASAVVVVTITGGATLTT